jgi:hypothetical protein
MPAASSPENPCAIAFQNGHRSARCSTGGRPGERSFARSDRFAFNFFAFIINTSNQDVLRRRVEFTQYTSLAFGERCKKMGVRPSMGNVGDAYDNAMAESFFASLECELIDRQTWQTKTEARLALFTWIEAWYNPIRRHSALEYLSPVNYETRYRRIQGLSVEPGLPTVGASVACATPPVDNPVTVSLETSEDLSP